jgi:hypothetical protein
MALAVAVLAILAGAAAWPSIQPHLAQLSALLGGRPVGPGAVPPSVSATYPILGDLTEKVDALEATVMPLAIRLDLVERRLGAAEEQMRRMAGDRGPTAAGDGTQTQKLSEELSRLREEFDAVRRLSTDQGGAVRLSAAR